MLRAAFEPEAGATGARPNHRPGAASSVDFDADSGMWRIRRYSDVRAALLDPDTFRPDNALSAVSALSPDTVRALASGGVALPPTLANNGGPRHPALRRLVAPFFTTAAVHAATGHIHRLATECAAAARQELNTTGRCDLAARITGAVPPRVLFHLLGLPDSRQPDPSAFRRWSEASFELFWGWPDHGRQAGLASAVVEFHQWLRNTLRAARRDDPATGFFPALAKQCDAADGLLTVREAISMASFVVLAGQQTTTWLLSNVFLRVLGSPGLWTQLAMRPDRAEEAVEETLRLHTSVTSWRRLTTRPVTVDGTRIPAGSTVLLMLSDAGRDPSVHERPTEFRPGRPTARTHLAFGAGPHFCLGAQLARTEAAVTLRAGLETLPADLHVRPDDGDGLGILSFQAPSGLVVTTPSLRQQVEATGDTSR